MERPGEPEQPDVVQRVHEEYIRAGAEVIIANTYASSRSALEPAGLGDHVAEANRSAVRAAMRAREAAATGPVTVAGSMSSFSAIDMYLGAERDPGSGPACDDPRLLRLADFREQAELLVEGGVDLIALELISARSYGSAAVTAATETWLPVWLGRQPGPPGRRHPRPPSHWHLACAVKPARRSARKPARPARRATS